MSFTTEPKEKTGRARSKGTSQSREDQVTDRRRSLLEATVKVISKRGLTGVTMNSIAAEAKCSYGVVAFHFQSKEGIILAALDYTAAEYEAYLNRLNEATLDPAERIRKMIDTDFSRKISDRAVIALWLAFWAEAVRVPAYRERCAALREHYNRTVEMDIRQLCERRSSKIDAAQVAVSLNAMISGLWIESLLRPMRAEQGHDACLGFMRLHFPEDF